MIKATKIFIISTFVSLYVVVSLISTIHSIDFFEMSNPHWLAVSLAVAFEIGAAASLASIITLDKMNKTIVWCLFFVLTGMQAMSNAYYAYSHLHDFKSWVELFGMVDDELITQKRVLSIISGAILPLVALGFIKSLVDYLKPSPLVIQPIVEDNIKENDIETVEKKLEDNAEELTTTNESSPVVDIIKPNEEEIITEPVNDLVSDPVKEEVINPEPPSEFTVGNIKVFKGDNGNK